MSSLIHMIVAMDSHWGIGVKSLSPKLPWNLPKEFQYFLKTIHQTESGYSPCWVMGRQSFEDHFQLPSGLFCQDTDHVYKIVLSKKWTQDALESPNWRHVPNVIVCNSWAEVESTVKSLTQSKKITEAFSIGGPQVYQAQFHHEQHNPEDSGGRKLLLTKIEGDFHCDMFFPQPDPEIWTESGDTDSIGKEEENGIVYSYHVYEVKR